MTELEQKIDAIVKKVAEAERLGGGFRIYLETAVRELAALVEEEADAKTDQHVLHDMLVSAGIVYRRPLSDGPEAGTWIAVHGGDNQGPGDGYTTLFHFDSDGNLERMHAGTSVRIAS